MTDQTWNTLLRAELPLAALVLHINRELIHHLAEVCLLRDLHLHTHLHTHLNTHLNTHRQTHREAS